MGIRKSVCVALIGLALISPAALAQERCTAEPVATLPMVILGGRVVVPVQINDQPALFLIDSTGAASAVSHAAVTRFKLQTFAMRADRTIRGIGNAQAHTYAKIDSLVVGNLKAEGERHMVGEFGPGIDGRLSHDYLRNFDLDIDFASNQLSLYRPRACAGKPPGAGAFASVGMDVMRSGKIRIPVTLDGKKIWAMVGIGTDGGNMPADVARSDFNLKPSETGRVRVLGATGGSAEVVPHTFSSLEIAGYAQARPELEISVDDDMLRPEQSQIMLGIGVMKGLRFYISYREREFYVSRPGGR